MLFTAVIWLAVEWWILSIGECNPIILLGKWKNSRFMFI